AGVYAAEGDGALQALTPPPAPARQTLGPALAAAVGRCADSSVAAALSLSGGIDSSCLAAELAAQGRRLPAYQFCATGQPEHERAIAARVAGHCGLQLCPVEAGPELLEALPALTAAYGMPLGDPSVLAVHAVAMAAARDGARVMLSGEGADELLLGYSRHRAMRWLPRRGLPWRLGPRWSMGRAARSLRAAVAAEPYHELLSVTPPAFREEVLAPELANATLPDGGPGEPLERARSLDKAFYLRWDLLPKLDVATMAAGVEGRCPFLDPAVRAACDELAPRQVLGKQPLRERYRDQLPEQVFAQRKRGFSLPLDEWFRAELGSLDLLREQRTLQRPHLRPNGLAKAIDLHRRGRVNLGHALYLVVAHEWHLRCEEEARRCA
ncbi:MAG: asparagine synthase C-terminal domain-containing protein, partial [Planctomycetota bacterium]|nr:asparagine synthase C-terminal domain-containing protein [Planctomycetota bacterium]